MKVIHYHGNTEQIPFKQGCEQEAASEADNQHGNYSKKMNISNTETV